MGRNCQFIEISRIRIDIFLCSFLIRFWVNNQREHLPVKLVLPIKYDFDMLVRLQGFSRSTQSISCLTRTPINQYPTHGNRLLLMPRLHQSNFILTPRRFDVNDPKNPNIKNTKSFPKILTPNISQTRILLSTFDSKLLLTSKYTNRNRFLKTPILFWIRKNNHQSNSRSLILTNKLWLSFQLQTAKRVEFNFDSKWLNSISHLSNIKNWF